jgi:pimeloyl-ACP methyl ester carboxylesterase
VATRRRAAARALSFFLAALLVAIAVVAAVPSLRARAKAVAVLARSAGIWFPRPFAGRVRVREIRPRPNLVADLYLPGPPAPAIVLAPGAGAEGRAEPRLIGVARALAGAGRAVLVPELELRNETLVTADVDRIVEAVLVAWAMSRRPVGLLSFSYGGSLAIVAAEDERIAEKLAFVATFGAYAHLGDVIQGVTTGATVYRGRTVAWTPAPEAREILQRAAVQLAPAADRASLGRALASDDPRGLSPSGRAIFELLANTDPQRTPPLLARLPPSFRRTLDRFSPLTQLHRLRAPLFLMQSDIDPSTPPTEALLLHERAPTSRLIRVRRFVHVSVPGSGTPLFARLADLFGAYEFTSWILEAQE